MNENKFQVIYKGRVEKETIVPVQDIGVMVSEASIEQLIEANKRKVLKSSFICRVLRGRGREALEEYAEAKGYESGWIYMQLNMDGTTFKDRAI